jgi:RNA polymerase sigma-70 factor (ECF subfamily)
VSDSRLDTAAVWSYDGDVQRWARQLCRHRQDAEDVAQTALMKAAQHVAGFRGEASVRTWLHRIVTNECAMLRRRTAPASLDALLDTEPRLGLDRAGRPVDFDPEQIALDRVAQTAVLTAVAQLPDRWRTVLLLSDGAGLPASAVASATGLSVSAVRAVLHRARTAIRREVTGT